MFSFATEICFFCSTLAVISGLPLSNVDRAVQSDAVLVPIAGGRVGGARSGGGTIKANDVPAGEALDLFYRYGFFSLSVRVVPRDDPGAWIIREPTAAIFTNVRQAKTTVPLQGAFEPNLQVFLCDDEAELFKSFFRDFSAEGIEESYKLYTGSWHQSTKSKYLGLSKGAFDGDTAYVLMKMRKPRYRVATDAASLAPNPDVGRAYSRLAVGDADAVEDLVKKFGSHLVDAVDVGEAVYQVFALDQEQYAALKRDVVGGSPSASAAMLSAHLQPWAVKEAGRPLAASGDRDVMAFVEESLGSSGSLLTLAEDPRLMSELESLTDLTESVIGLRFSSLGRFVPDIQAREFYQGVVNTNAMLWQANI